MMRLSRLTFGCSIIVGALGAATAWAQDFTAGRTPAQLFASDCSACHKSPQGLAKGHDARSLTLFLREHYTTKEASAVALASFLSGQRGAAEQRPTAAGPKPKPETPPAAAAEGDAASKPAARPRTAAAPAANPVNPTHPEDKAGEGEGQKPRAMRTSEPRSRRAAVPPAEPAAQGEPTREPPAATENPIIPEEPKPARERARDGREPAAEKLNSYAGAGGNAKEIARSADPSKKLESYTTSGATPPVDAADKPKSDGPKPDLPKEASVPPADAPIQDAPKEAVAPAADASKSDASNEVAAPAADGPKDAATPTSEAGAAEAAAPSPADEPKPAKKRKGADKKKHAAAAAPQTTASVPASATPRQSRPQRRTPPIVQPIPGNN